MSNILSRKPTSGKNPQQARVGFKGSSILASTPRHSLVVDVFRKLDQNEKTDKPLVVMLTVQTLAVAAFDRFSIFILIGEPQGRV